ncbi:hypothetical protein SERLADRAFT_437562 [Serpula lacrymans var. lacrymans S7.9]|uniref:Uncharacterized protein n=1 Tax=Serpula lacrymans var. lacrymans (strain S7.9) TaxID=578457 RepID=F8NUC4_SERL9|nr:uncharacterized protein SERLADRAFT_437562 [Serpula lacrymans var. lacrymans S7.9]EGO25836.1 hypothetical protein SERLADRAFT_437562 [Serpula lacrymans var. lacrymans S7.9]
MSKSPKDSPPGTMRRPEAGSPSNPINVDNADMVNQLYAGTYNLGDDDCPTPQSNTSSNTRQKYYQAYYCPDCDHYAPGHSFNWCPIRRENKDRILMEGLHGDVSYNDSYNMDGEGTKFR